MADDNSAHVTNDASVISVTVDVHAPAHSSPAIYLAILYHGTIDMFSVCSNLQ